MVIEDNNALVGNALLILQQGLSPFVEREMEAAFPEDRNRGIRSPINRLTDCAVLLRTVESNWRSIFGHRLGRLERSIVNELLQHRNRWAHQDHFDDDDAYRVLDSAERLLRAVGAEDQAKTVKDLRLEFHHVGDSKQTSEAEFVQKSLQQLDEFPILPPQFSSSVASRHAATSTGVKGKYRRLYEHLRRVKSDSVTMSFHEIESILGESLPPSAKRYVMWWRRSDYWQEAGFEAHVDLRRQRTTFARKRVISF
jgi:hypothetical protein